MQFLPQFGNIAFTLLAFVAALSIIVAIHEYGHYIVGRWSGIHAEVFSLGFGPVLWSRVDRHGTRWQVAALPLGGYVKFLGDANAASVGGDLTGITEADRRRTMLGAPIWARSATVAAGPIFNFVLSLMIFAGVYMLSGTPRDPLTIARLDPLPPAYSGQLAAGDQIVSIAGIALTGPNFQALEGAALPESPLVDYVIRRDGTELAVQGPHPRAPVIGSISPASAAYEGGLRPGDVVLAIDGADVFTFTAIVARVAAAGGTQMQFDVWRAGDVLSVDLIPRRTDLPAANGGFESRWLVGIVSGSFMEPETEAIGPVEALSDGAAQVWRIITSSLSGLWHIVTGAISTCNISGPVGIAQTSGAMASQGGTSFIWFVAVLSTAVGLLNLFPVPMLDGGHLVFHAWEAVTGRPPADAALRILMSFGLAAILGLMIFALMNDLFLCP